MELPLIIIPGQDKWANKFWNKIITTYIYHSIRNDGLYIVSEHVFLWAYDIILRVINYEWCLIIVKSNLFWVFHSWRDYVAYTILWNFE